MGSPDSVKIEVPAHASYVAVLRAAVSALASRLTFTIDEVDDLRIAVDEAAALLLPGCVDGDQLRCELAMASNEIRCVLSVPVSGHEIPKDGFAWLVLNSVAREVATSQDDGRTAISLVRAQGPAEHSAG